jgi:hypothetical protein
MREWSRQGYPCPLVGDHSNGQPPELSLRIEYAFDANHPDDSGGTPTKPNY